MFKVCQREIGILTLKGLGEDILTLENISTKERKKQMMAELRNCVENIANFLKANMQVRVHCIGVVVYEFIFN